MNSKNKRILSFGFIIMLFLSLFISSNVFATDIKSEKILRAANSFDLTSEVSVTKLSNYTDTAIINFKVNHRDPSSSLYDGKLEIDLGSSTFEVVNFPANSTANSNVKSATIDYKSNKISVILRTPITTGTQFDYSVVVRLSGTVAANDNVTVSAKLNGNNSSGIPYVEETTTTPAIIADVPGASLIDPDNPEWTVLTNPRNWTVYPGTSIDSYNYIRQGVGNNTSFKNLRVVWEKGNSEGIVKSGATRFVYLQDTVNATSITRQCNETSNTTSELTCEYGEVNGNVYNSVLLYPSGAFLVPADAVDGTVYSSTVKIYDEDRLISSYPMNITVKTLETKVDVTPKLNRATIAQGDYFDWYDHLSVTSGGTGVKDLKVTVDIPEGVNPVGMYFIDNASESKVKSLEIYQNGSWVKINEVTTSSQFFDDFDKYLTNGKIEKIRYQRNDMISVATARPVFFRFVGNDIVDGQDYSIKTSEVTYLDHADVAQSLDLSAAKYTVTMNGVDTVSDVPKIMGYTKPNGAANDFENVFFNGNTISQSLILMNSLGSLENPYVFIKVPKGVKLNNDIKIGQAYGQSPGYWMSSSNVQAGSISKPKGNVDFKTNSIELSDGSTLVYYILPEGQLLAGSGPSDATSTRVQLYMIMVLESLPSGDYEVEFGAGSMTSDNYNINTYYDTYAGLNILKLDNLPEDYKTVIPGVTSNKYLTLKRKFTVGINNSVTSKMEIKGSQDNKYVDATATNAESLPGKEVNYKVTLTNKGTNDLTNFEAVDILPYVGDTSVNNPSVSRNSDYRVNLLGEVKVLVDGIETSDAYVLYSTSTDPIRYVDSAGNTIGTGTWTNTPPGDLTSVRAIKVVMPSKSFKINSTIELSFKGAVPLDVPRDGTSIAYNSIGISGDTVTLTGNEKFVTEPAKGGVKATLPATDIELSGLSYMDMNKNGSKETTEAGYNGVTLNLYEKQSDNTFKKVDSVTSAPDSSNNPGIFGFTGINNGTYKIEIDLTNNENASFVTAGTDRVVDVNGKKGYISINGSSEFSVDDLGSNPKKITNLKIPLYIVTPFKGSIKFFDKNGAEVTGTEYGKGFNIQLQNSSGADISGATATSLADGTFSISGIEAGSVAEYKLAFTKPTGKNFIYPANNDSNMNTTTGVYTITGLNPGEVGIADIYISDNDNPNISITKDKDYNPSSIVLSDSDATTDTSVNYVIKLNGVQVDSGTTTTVTIPTTDGVYTIEAKAIDAALNESSLETTSFTIDKTAPTANITIEPSTKINPTKVEISATDVLDSAPKLTYTLKKGSSTIDSGTNVDSPQDLLSKATSDGVYTIEVSATDIAGNVSTKVSDTFTVDNTAPLPVITIVPINKINPTKVEIAATDAIDNAPKLTYTLKKGSSTIDSGTGVTSPQDLLSKATSDGIYTVEVSAKDTAGNESSLITDTFTIDTVAPVISTSKESHTVKVGSNAISSADLKSIFDVSASDEIDGTINNISVEGSVNVNKVGEYTIVFKSSDNALNEATKTVKVIVEKIVIGGIVYNDSNYNSTKDDVGVLEGVTIKLINLDTDEEIASTITDDNGEYEFKIPGAESVTNYGIMAIAKTGYILADKGNDSIVSVTTAKSDAMKTSGVDYLNKNIGMAKDVTASIAPSTQKVYVGDTVSSTLSVTNGSISTSSISNGNASYITVSGGYDITGVKAGTSILSVVIKDGYNRNTITVTQNINVIALPTASGSNIAMTKGDEKASNMIFTPSDGIISYTSSYSTRVNVDSNGMLKALNIGVSIVSGKVITDDTEAKEAESKIVAAVGQQTAPVIQQSKTRATIIYEVIDAINFDLTYEEASNMTEEMLKTKGEVWVQTVDDNWDIADVAIEDINVDYSAIDLSQVPEDGSKVFTIKYSGPHTGVEKEVEVIVAGKNSVVNPTNNEGISAKGFSITEKEAGQLDANKVIDLAKAKAWKLDDGSSVAITNVDYSKVKAKAGTYEVTLSTDKGTSITIEINVTKVDEPVKPVEPEKPKKPELPETGVDLSFTIILTMIGFTLFRLRKRFTE